MANMVVLRDVVIGIFALVAIAVPTHAQFSDDVAYLVQTQQAGRPPYHEVELAQEIGHSLYQFGLLVHMISLLGGKHTDQLSSLVAIEQRTMPGPCMSSRD
ncbi:MAG TPA: hypothetical protein VNP04_18415 [Alphaproteobacteria bacterium]|nr:hypothetical protein [Alphaproteobacteria bacterium]